MCIVNKFLVCHALLLSPLLLSAALPDLAVVDKLFKEKRYAEALKGYAACEKCQIGERGYVILQTAICAERIGDGVRRGKALRKLCALEPAGADAKYVEAATGCGTRGMSRRAATRETSTVSYGRHAPSSAAAALRLGSQPVNWRSRSLRATGDRR